MKILILSRNASLYSTNRLVEAATERDCEVAVVDYLRCYMNITTKRPKVLYRKKELVCDAIVPRIGASHTLYGCAVVRQFEVMDVFSANESQAIARSRDKLRSLQLLSRHSIGLPVTSYAHSTKDIGGLMDIVGGAPLVVKLLEGTQGNGVVLAETTKAAESVIGAFRQLDANILVQRFVEEAKGADIRALVVGGKVVAAMERQAKQGEFRANLHLGGVARLIELTDEEAETAVAAANVLGLGVAGVDILRGTDGPLVIEVNSSPGLEGIEKSTGLDVAGSVIDYVMENASSGGTRDLIGK
jgi:ribosomal protein S6--L-glutamate ligase